MPTRIDPGHYRVDETDREDETNNTSVTRRYGVVRGDVANEADYGIFDKQFGFRSSKWYAYCLINTEVVPRISGTSPTAPASAYAEHFSELKFAQNEFDTKQEAVARAEEMVDDYKF